MTVKMSVFFVMIWLVLSPVSDVPKACAGDENGLKAEPSISSEIEVPGYIIGSGDILGIMTWGEPDFSVEAVMVRKDGMITLPILNDIRAANRTTMALQREITERLKAFVENPVVTVTLRNPVSEKFYILGEVVRTGEYALVKDLTVLQAFALAGGFTEWASRKEIILLRHAGGKDRTMRIRYRNPVSDEMDTILLKDEGNEEIIRINYRDIVKGKGLSQNIKIQANDTIIVP